MTKIDLIIMLKPYIPAVGSLAEIHFENTCQMLNNGIWTKEDLIQWAQNFANDPWRKQNKRYRTISHFLRQPDRWMEEVKQEEDKWNVKNIASKQE